MSKREDNGETSLDSTFLAVAYKAGRIRIKLVAIWCTSEHTEQNIPSPEGWGYRHLMRTPGFHCKAQPIAVEAHFELVALAVKVKAVAVLDVHAGKLDEAIATKLCSCNCNRSMYKSFQTYVCLLSKKCNKTHVQLSVKLLWLQGA